MVGKVTLRSQTHIHPHTIAQAHANRVVKAQGIRNFQEGKEEGPNIYENEKLVLILREKMLVQN